MVAGAGVELVAVTGVRTVGRGGGFVIVGDVLDIDDVDAKVEDPFGGIQMDELAERW